MYTKMPAASAVRSYFFLEPIILLLFGVLVAVTVVVFLLLPSNSLIAIHL